MEIIQRNSGFNKNGAKVSYGFTTDGLLDGRYIEYYPNSNVKKRTISFDKGRASNYTEYHTTGKERITACTDSEKICKINDPKVIFLGQYIEFDPEGNIIRSEFIPRR